MTNPNVSSRAHRSARLFSISIALVAITASCDGNSHNAIDSSNLDDRNNETPEDPTPAPEPDPQDPTPGDCDPQPWPENDCEVNGALCLPLDPSGMSPPCPEGLYELPLGCPYDETNQIASACCGFAEDPGPGPMEDPCAWSGGVCWEADETGNVACPEGLEARYEIPCFIEDGMGPFSVCCTFVEYPPPPPTEECPDPSDPWIRYMGEGPEICDAIEYLCGEEGSPFISPCGCGCVIRPDEPPPPPPEEQRCPDASDPDVIYVSEDLAVCNTISYTCPSNHVVFTSPCGCGCLGY